ncbi:50S ribosomal protein L6 [Patescibacteria group bacterium]|nr:50S ribosomal protein L6 [Patescibacteria group bacterium]MBU2220002.1 50S ribosomal protein L6 [Patescibacteria group bacterium]MBU2264558.1 50S ribosomal protein L6 [Patescibacteria group bacterium]
MSKIGKQPVLILEGVTVKIDGSLVLVKGPKGELRREMVREIKAEMKENEVIVSVAKQTKRSAALWGLTRMLIANMIEGVKNGFEKKLEIEGVGYKVALQGNNLVLNLGFSHPVEVKAVPGITFKVDKNIIIISGIDKEAVGQTAANIRKIKKPEPYKGKGIHYLGEIIKRKAGKKAVKGGF